jgi:predicted RNase H-like HicB family nuclease
MVDYRVQLTPDDNGTFLVTCPQLPIVATFGETEPEALRHAVDAIETYPPSNAAVSFLRACLETRTGGVVSRSSGRSWRGAPSRWTPECLNEQESRGLG